MVKRQVKTPESFPQVWIESKCHDTQIKQVKNSAQRIRGHHTKANLVRFCNSQNETALYILCRFYDFAIASNQNLYSKSVLEIILCTCSRRWSLFLGWTGIKARCILRQKSHYNENQLLYSSRLSEKYCNFNVTSKSHQSRSSVVLMWTHSTTTYFHKVKVNQLFANCFA